MKSRTNRPPKRNVIDNPVQGPVSLASGSNTTYLVYQLATGEVYVTTANASFSFPARQSLVSGQGGLPAAAAASGPAVAFDPVGRVIVAYLSADGTHIVVASSDPQLATGWTEVAGIPLNGIPLMPGLAMISGSVNGVSLTTLYAAATSGGIICASSIPTWAAGFQSATFQGTPMNPPSASGVSANLLPSSGQIVLGFAIPSQNQAVLFTSTPGSRTDFIGSSVIPINSGLTPAVTIEPDNGAWNVFVNAAQTVYYITHYNGQWQTPQPIDDMSLSMAGPPGAAWNELVLYFACTDRAQNLDYDMIALGTSKSGARKPRRAGAGKRAGASRPAEAPELAAVTEAK